MLLHLLDFHRIMYFLIFNTKSCMIVSVLKKNIYYLSEIDIVLTLLLLMFKIWKEQVNIKLCNSAMNVCLMCHQNLRKTSEERRLKEEQSSNRHWVILKRVWAVNRVREPCRKWTFVVYISLFIHIYSLVFGISTQLYNVITYQFLLLKYSQKNKMRGKMLI